MIFLLNLQESSEIFSKQSLRTNIPSEITERSRLVRWPDDEDYDDDDQLGVEVIVEEKREDGSDFIGPENRRIDYNSPALIHTFF